MVQIIHYHDRDAIKTIVSALNQHRLVALPTETVYGLAADATSECAVNKIFIAKQRPAINPLICHIHPDFDLTDYAHIDSRIEKIMQELWPGAISFVVELKQDSPIAPSVTAGLNSVAFRMPDHAFFQSVLKEFGKPLAAPSANKSKSLSPTKAEHVALSLAHEEELLVVDAGQCPIGIESTILDLREQVPVILRCGQYTLEQLEQKLHMRLADHSQSPSEKIIAPGQLLLHYAPQKPLRLNVKEPQQDEIWLSFGNHDRIHPLELKLSPKGDLDEAAKNLFDFLWQADQTKAPYIAVAPIPQEGVGIAINDRLCRAAHKTVKAKIE